MATEEEIVNLPQEEMTAGFEPGASRHSLLLSSDSFEDLSSLVENELTIGSRKKLPSGTIDAIASGTEISLDKRLEELKENSDTGSARTTPSSELSSEETIQKPVLNHTDHATDSGSEVTEPEADIDEDLEYVHSSEWRNQKTHVFILSEAGKPIYSRYGNEDKLVTTMGVLQALVSFVQCNKDNIRCIQAGEHRFVFLVRDHLILVSVSKSVESVPQMMAQLKYIYNQVISVLTYSQLTRIFKQRKNYDLRRLLTGAEKFFDNLLNLMDTDPSYMLNAVRCLPLDSQVRDTIVQSIQQNAKVKNLVFAILLAENQLISLVRMKKYFLHPMDLHLIFNLVSASESFKAAESWTPICLPMFDSAGYLHAHISYLDEACHTCLLLLTVDRDMFFPLSECKQKIQDRLIRHNCLKAISESVKRTKYKIGQVDIPELRHFMYKSKSTAQYTSPEHEAPYTTQEEKDRLFGLYQYLNHRMHGSSRQLKILYHVGPYETLLGWVTSGFELYAVFGPLVTKNIAIHSVNKLLKWIKREEDKLFILNSPTF